jgi:hypothetical protein
MIDNGKKKYSDVACASKHEYEDADHDEDGAAITPFSLIVDLRYCWCW